MTARRTLFVYGGMLAAGFGLFAWITIRQALPAVAEAPGHTTRVADVTRMTILKLRRPSEARPPRRLWIQGRGQIEGRAELQLLRRGSPCRTELLAGAVEFDWNEAWTGNVAELRYQPAAVRGGSLDLRYRFRD